MVSIMFWMIGLPSQTQRNAMGKREGIFYLFEFHVQERVWEHDCQWKDQKEAEGGMDESNVEGSLSELGWMGDEDCHVRIYE